MPCLTAPLQTVTAVTNTGHRHVSRTLVDKGPLHTVGDGHPLDKPLDRGIGRHNLITTEKNIKFESVQTCPKRLALIHRNLGLRFGVSFKCKSLDIAG